MFYFLGSRIFFISQNGSRLEKVGRSWFKEFFFREVIKATILSEDICIKSIVKLSLFQFYLRSILNIFNKNYHFSYFEQRVCLRKAIFAVSMLICPTHQMKFSQI